MKISSSIISLAALATRVSAVPRPQEGNFINLNGDSNCQPNPQCGNGEEVFSEYENPDPHQLYKFVQLTRNTGCGATGTCEIAKSMVKGKSVAVSGGIELTGKGFLSAGFEVAEYTEAGDVPNCQANEGETVCVYLRQGHTMYTVNAQRRDNCCEATGDIYQTTITAPNVNKGVDNICARGHQCVGEGNTYWNSMDGDGKGTAPGGPQRWPFGDDEDGLRSF